MKRKRATALPGSGRALRGASGCGQSCCEHRHHGGPGDMLAPKAADIRGGEDGSLALAVTRFGNDRWVPNRAGVSQSSRLRPGAVPSRPWRGAKEPRFAMRNACVARGDRNGRKHGWRGLAGGRRRFRAFALTPRVDFLTNLCRILRLSMKTLALPLAGPSFWRMCARPRGGAARQTPSGNPGRRPAGFPAATGTSPYATSNPSDCGWSFPARRWQRPNNQDTSPIF